MGCRWRTLSAGEVHFLVDMDTAQRWQAQTALIRRPAPTVTA